MKYGFVFTGNGVSQNKPIQARPPGIFCKAGQAGLKPAVFIYPPANVGIFDPLFDDFKIRLCQSESFFDAGKLKQPGNLNRAKSAAGNFNQGQESINHSVCAAGVLICDTEGDVQRFLGLSRKHRLHIGRIGFNIRCHHDDVFRQQIRVFFKHGQQIVVQNFDFPHGTVTGMDLNRSIVF